MYALVTPIKFIFSKYFLNIDFLGKPLKTFECDTCGRVYNHRASLFNHKKFTCGTKSILKCKMCQFSTKYFYYMKQHYFRTHGIKKISHEKE